MIRIGSRIKIGKNVDHHNDWGSKGNAMEGFPHQVDLEEMTHPHQELPDPKEFL